MTGESIEKKLTDYINMKKESAELKASFIIFEDNIMYDVDYNICIGREKDNFAVIEKESLSCSKIIEDKKINNKTIFMEFKRDNREDIFTPKKRLEELLDENKEDKTDLIVAKKMAEKSNCSYIFGTNSREIFFKKYDGKFQQYSFIINRLFDFAVKDLFVINYVLSGVISAKIVLPMAFRIDSENNGVKGDLPVSLLETTILDNEDLKILRNIIEEINTVLYTIIPGLRIDIKEYGSQLMDNGEEGHKIELMSSREGMPSFPIRMESEGIIKIISILNALIQAFSDPSICLAIDELDAGIFEYILGELLQIFDESAKGQLIFTSHNLRPLEILENDALLYTTVNPENCYIKSSYIKNTQNTLLSYLRTIKLGGQKEKLYNETNIYEMELAMRRAGRDYK